MSERNNKPRNQYTSIDELAIAKKNLKAAGYEIKGWSRSRGFNYFTVLKLFVHGRGASRGGRISRNIIAQLKKEGFWPADQKSRRAA